MRINYISNKLLFLAKGLFMMLFILAITTSCSDDDTTTPDPEEEPEPEPEPDPDPEPLEVVEFASEALKAVIVKEYDTNDDSEIDLDEAEKVTEIDVDGITAITTMEDIANFANLQTLICCSTGITSLDITKNEALVYLDASDTNIGNGTRGAESCLDTSNNPLLEYLDLSNTNIMILNLGNNTALKELYLTSSLLEELDLSNNLELLILNISQTNITLIDLSNNTLLQHLNASGSTLELIDLSDNAALLVLDISDTNITQIDLYNAISLVEFIASGSALESIDLSANKALEILYLSGTDITKISLTYNTALKDLDLSDTTITSLILTKCIALESLNVSGTNLWILDVSYCANLESLNVDDCDRLYTLLYDGTTQGDYDWVDDISGVFMDDTTVPNYNTDYPDSATVYVSAEWTTLHDGDTAPTEYAIYNDGTEKKVSSTTTYILDPAADNDFVVYNFPSGITITDGVATLNEATRAATDPEPNPEHLYYGVGSTTLIADNISYVKVATKRATAPLTLNLNYTPSEVANIKSVTIGLSGIAQTRDLNTDALSDSGTLTQYITSLSNAESSITISYNILGTIGDSQMLKITFITIDDQTIIVESDITSQLTSFNDDMEPVTLAGDMNLPTDFETEGSIKDWEDVNEESGTAN